MGPRTKQRFASTSKLQQQLKLTTTGTGGARRAQERSNKFALSLGRRRRLWRAGLRWNSPRRLAARSGRTHKYKFASSLVSSLLVAGPVSRSSCQTISRRPLLRCTNGRSTMATARGEPRAKRRLTFAWPQLLHTLFAFQQCVELLKLSHDDGDKDFVWPNPREGQRAKGRQFIPLAAWLAQRQTWLGSQFG